MSMDEYAAHSHLRDRVTTIAAVWLALAVAGMSIAWLSDSLPAAAISLGVYILLLALYAFVTGPGRRTPLPAYLIGGILYPVMAVALLLLLVSLEPPEPVFDIISMIGAGLNVGFGPSAGPDAPIEFYLPYWALNLLVPIIIVVGARNLIGRRSGG